MKNRARGSSQSHLRENTGQDCFSSPVHMILLKVQRITSVNYLICFTEECHGMNEQFICAPLQADNNKMEFETCSKLPIGCSII